MSDPTGYMAQQWLDRKEDWDAWLDALRVAPYTQMQVIYHIKEDEEVATYEFEDGSRLVLNLTDKVVECCSGP